MVWNNEKLKMAPTKIVSLMVGLTLSTMPWSEKGTTVLSIALVICLLYFSVFRGKRLKMNYKDIAIASMIFIISAIGLLFTEEIGVGLKYLERISSGLLFPIVFMVIAQRIHLKLSWILIFFMGSCMLRYFVFLGSFIDLELIYIWDYWKEIILQFNQFFKQGALHPTYFSMYLGFCSLVCLDFITKPVKRKMKIMWASLFSILFIMNFSLGAKMPFIALLLAIFVGFWLFVRRSYLRGHKRKYVLVLILGIVVITIFLFKVPNSISQDIKNYYDLFSGNNLQASYDYSQLGTEYSFDTWTRTNRVYIWKSATQVFKQNPFFGVGTGDIQLELVAQYGKDGEEYLAKNSANTHNQYLDFLLKFGILGFLPILWAFIKYLEKSLSHKDILYTSFLILIFGSMLTENIINRQMGIIFFFLLNSMFYFHGAKIGQS
jgi:O-antigen ligase